MSCDSGILNIPSNGLYRLYLQITFEFESEKYTNSDICANDLLSLKITVERRSNSYLDIRELLVSEDTMSCTHDWTRSMFTSGTFVLDAQSQIRVKILHKQLVNIHDTRSFFGAELISTR